MNRKQLIALSIQNKINQIKTVAAAISYHTFSNAHMGVRTIIAAKDFQR